VVPDVRSTAGPLGPGYALRHPVVAELAARHARTPAQVVLRWHLQLGDVAIPKVTGCLGSDPG
jgi:2,5-diketo-D-gluconate reductase A